MGKPHMNDVDHYAGEPAEKQTVTPRQEEPTPIITLHSNGRIELHRQNVSQEELQRILLSTVLTISNDAMQRAAVTYRLLEKINAGFGGFGPDIEGELAAILGQRHPGPS
jgi:hypothetical protein